MTTKHGVEDHLERIDGLFYRNRHIVGPPAVALLAFVLGSVAWWFDLQLWAVGVAAIVLFCALDHILDLKSKRERTYASVCWILGPGWVVALAFFGPTRFLVVAGASALLILWPFWVRHRRVRRGVNVDRTIEAWGDGKAVGLPGTQARGKEAGAGWFTFRLSAKEPGTYTLSSYKGQAHRIAARFGVRADAISFENTKTEGEVIVSVREEDQKTSTPEEVTKQLSITDRHKIGRTDNGAPLEMQLNIPGRGAQHGAAIGATGSGKSSLVNRIAQIVVASEESDLWIVDMSYGAKELRAWAPACDWFANTKDEVDKMLRVLPKMAEARGKQAGRLHSPSADSPAIVLVIDEGASVWAPELGAGSGVVLETKERMAAMRAAKARKDAAGELLRLARKYGISVVEATQYGVEDALGGPTAKQQVTSGYVSVFYSAKNTDGHLLIPASAGVRCSEIPQSAPGTCFMRGPTTDGVVRGRIDYMTDELIEATVNHWADKQPVLEPELVRVGGDDYASRNRRAPWADTDEFGDGGTDGDTDGGTDIVERPDTEVVPVPGGPLVAGSVPASQRLTPEESRELILNAVGQFPNGAGATDVSKLTGRSPSLVHARIKELAAEGKIKPGARGRWILAG